MAVIPARRKPRQKNYELEVSLCNTVNSRQASAPFLDAVSYPTFKISASRTGSFCLCSNSTQTETAQIYLLNKC